MMLARIGPLLAVSVIGYIVMFALTGGLMATTMPQMMTSIQEGVTSPAAVVAGAGFGLILFYIVIYGVSFAQQVALCRLCSDRHEPSVGGAIGAGVKSVPTLFGAAILLLIAAVVAMLVVSVAIAGVAAGSDSPALAFVIGLLALIGCVWPLARLSMILPVVAVDEVRNPITAVSRAWQLTSGNTLRLVLVYALMMVVTGLLLMVFSALTLGSFSPGAVPSIGSMIGFGTLMLVFGLTVGLYFTALVAAIHAQLAGVSVSAVEDTFA